MSLDLAYSRSSASKPSMPLSEGQGFLEGVDGARLVARRLEGGAGPHEEGPSLGRRSGQLRLLERNFRELLGVAGLLEEAPQRVQGLPVLRRLGQQRLPVLDGVLGLARGARAARRRPAPGRRWPPEARELLRPTCS